ncbi:hypothetical protein BAZ10_07460 [Elizabethkingia occulta]|uniref:Uncharacterized protein n=1 Tax=Elizabethkingia occulta TaxID=1867263 RepID=A0A1T3MFD5_9FLAO|nr:hypothetical protein BB020_11505 [Elizabethkingia occulta]OPC63000.1 hypothetical protein BAZ10_07460 [Elizabethkingia occulta]
MLYAKVKILEEMIINLLFYLFLKKVVNLNEANNRIGYNNRPKHPSVNTINYKANTTRQINKSDF